MKDKKNECQRRIVHNVLALNIFCCGIGGASQKHALEKKKGFTVYVVQ